MAMEAKVISGIVNGRIERASCKQHAPRRRERTRHPCTKPVKLLQPPPPSPPPPPPRAAPSIHPTLSLSSVPPSSQGGHSARMISVQLWCRKALSLSYKPPGPHAVPREARKSTTTAVVVPGTPIQQQWPLLVTLMALSQGSSQVC